MLALVPWWLRRGMTVLFFGSERAVVAVRERGKEKIEARG